jgi:membrane protein implicated in regulation of membrane protease activity
MVGALRKPTTGEQPPPWDWRALGWVTGAVVLFALLLAPLGFVAALAALVVTAARAHPGFTWKGALATAAALTVLAVLVFDRLIDLRLPLWPGGFG